LFTAYAQLLTDASDPAYPDMNAMFIQLALQPIRTTGLTRPFMRNLNFKFQSCILSRPL
jgi:hypothetical protein